MERSPSRLSNKCRAVINRAPREACPHNHTSVTLYTVCDRTAERLMNSKLGHISLDQHESSLMEVDTHKPLTSEAPLCCGKWHVWEYFSIPCLCSAHVKYCAVREASLTAHYPSLTSRGDSECTYVRSSKKCQIPTDKQFSFQSWDFFQRNYISMLLIKRGCNL